MQLKLAMPLKISCYNDEIQLTGKLQCVHRDQVLGPQHAQRISVILCLRRFINIQKSEKR